MEINSQINSSAVSPRPAPLAQRPPQPTPSESDNTQSTTQNADASQLSQTASNPPSSRPVTPINSEQEALNATVKFRQAVINEPTLTQEAQSNRVTSDMVAGLVGE